MALYRDLGKWVITSKDNRVGTCDSFRELLMIGLLFLFLFFFEDTEIKSCSFIGNFEYTIVFSLVVYSFINFMS